MPFKRLSLRFREPYAHLEAPFKKEYVRASLQHTRISLVLAALLFAGFGFLDVYLMPNHQQMVWFIRFAVVCPALLGVAGLTFVPAALHLIQPLLAVMIVITGGGIIAMILVAPPPVNHLYYAGVILVFMFAYTYIRVGIIWASLGCWFLVVLYEIVAIVLIQTPTMILVSNNFFFVSANVVGMLACYAIEYNARRDFFLVYLLAEEKEKVNTINRELEQRVEARTRELMRINHNLEREIAVREKLSAQLKQAEKMEAIGSLAAGVAHDLNNILSGLVGYPELVLMDLPADSPLRAPILTIKSSGEKAAAVVQDLLTLARRGVADKTVLDLNTLVREYLDSPECLSLRQAHPHVRITTALEEDLLNVLAPAVHLTKTIMNLVANAAEALLVPGEITIATTNRYIDQPLKGYETITDGEYVLLSVQDTGVGIDAADCQHIFEPFFTKKQLGRSGTGLGMTVVWSTIKDLGGFVDVHSAEGRGTRFDLYLPVTRLEMTAVPRRVTIEDYRGSEEILVVDDVAEQREIAARMLSKLGYTVNTVSSGEEALEFLRESTVDILILDMIMDPGIDGCETYRRIIQHHPGQRAIVASGFSESERFREIQRLGVGTYLKKPYTLEKIAMAVRRELERPAPDAGGGRPDARTSTG
ncbi:MAG: response regulator [Desulfobacterales bacterium]|jgi:signal transduction histidine kinase/ActR/RegA family two-component response regulator